MSGELFKEGGPYNIKRTGPDQHSMQIPIPPGGDGLMGRECPQDGCTPAYFKVKLGTGLTGEAEAFCPYCRLKTSTSRFVSQGQLDYAKQIAMRETQKGIADLVGNALGLGLSGEKTIEGGFFNMKMSYKPADLPVVQRPVEEELRRDLICPYCTLDHSVYGLATWCPDCGKDIFLTHVDAEFQAVRKMLGDVERRRDQFGPRVAACDIENALEDTVSIFEAVLKVIARRHLIGRGLQPMEVEDIIAKKIANRFQNLIIAAEVCQRELVFDLLTSLSTQDTAFLNATFEKRHPITHNLGTVDAKYLRKARTGELQGRDVRVTAADVDTAIKLSLAVLTNAHHRLSPAESE